jgi:Pvc16 N-terminal domain
MPATADYDDATIDILPDVSGILRQILVAGLPPELNIGENDVLFTSPGEANPERLRKVLVYLYHLSENPSLRNTPSSVSAPALSARAHPPSSDTSSPGTFSPSNSRAQITRAPLPLDLHYMIVPFGQDPLFELQLLGTIKRLLFRIGKIIIADQPANRMRSNLLATGNSDLQLVPRNLPVDELSKMWGMFRNDHTFRPSLYYTITPVWLPSGESVNVPRVAQLVANSSTSSP